MAPVLSRRVLSGNHVRLKWPNDVLVGDKKLCGILIEMDDDRLLIGIGCNVMTAPVVTEVGIDGGRQSTSLSEHDLYTSSPLLSDTNSNGTGITTLTTATDECKESTATDNTCVASSVTESEENMNTQRVEHYGTICEELAAEITAAIANWIRDADNQDMVISEFESWMDFSPQILRKEYKTLDTSKSDSDMVSLKGETIIPIRLNSDGTLVVKLVNSGEEKVLIADYLW